MHLVPVSIDSIRLHQPLPCPLMDKHGVLLAKRAFVINSKEDLADIALRGGGLFIDVADSEAHHRAYVESLHKLVRSNKSLGEIANAQITADVLSARNAQDNDRPDWLDLQMQGNTLLRDTNAVQFMERLLRLHSQLRRFAHRNPDGTLFALVHLSATEVHMYSATHSMLVSVMCGLAAREVLKWPEEREAQLCMAALTMNLGMTQLQDQLTRQLEAPTPAQRKIIDAHATTQVPGSLGSRTPAQQIARLMQRADMFAARLAPRATRTPISPAAAMQACYFDETRQVDEAGAALIKAVGIYQPGTFVRLATDEVAVVVKRGVNTSTPRVAVLISRSGMPTMEPTIRDTSARDYRIVSSVPHRDVRVQINLERLLPLTAGPASDRPW
jgi:HD-GYP domain-containing protein (c-di-GMP phosphodiesterase class II)